MGCLDKAKTDLKDWALRLNEDCLKSWLLLAKVSFLTGNYTEMEEYIAEAKKRNPKNLEFVEGLYFILGVSAKFSSTNF